MSFLNKCHVGNCIDVMQQMPDNYIDLTVTSPPYSDFRDYNGYVFDFKLIALELKRITKDGGVVVWVVNDKTKNGSETGDSFRQALYFQDIGFNIHDTMIWNKNSCRYPETNRYYPSFEYMFVFSKGAPKTHNLIKDRQNKYVGAKVARKKTMRTKDGRIIENSAYRLDPDRKIQPYGVRYNIWNIPVSSSSKDKLALKHPATFPEQLANDHILTWTNPDDIVLDPMCGSGTTLKMAKINNRNYIGIDISKEYIEIAEQRLANV